MQAVTFGGLQQATLPSSHVQGLVDETEAIAMTLAAKHIIGLAAAQTYRSWFCAYPASRISKLYHNI
jgi:hypothetical protein